MKTLYLGLKTNGKDENLIHFPIIKIKPRPLDEEIKSAFLDICKFTHIVFTSQSSVEIFFQHLKSLKMNILCIKDACVIAVGKSTAEKILSYNITPIIISSFETAEGIVSEFEKLPLEKAFIFWPRSALARPVLTDYFKQKQLVYRDCILYDTLTHQPGPLPNLNEISEIVFTSPSTVDAFLELFGKFPENIPLKTIGPITKAHLEKIWSAVTCHRNPNFFEHRTKTYTRPATKAMVAPPGQSR